MYRGLSFLSVLCLGLAVGGCDSSESQRAKNNIDDSAKSQKLAVERDAAARQKAIDEAIERDAAAKQKSIDERAASTKDAVNQNDDARRTENKREATNDRQNAKNLEDAAEKAKVDAAEADKRAKDIK
jgi:hypothetical protein